MTKQERIEELQRKHNEEVMKVINEPDEVDSVKERLMPNDMFYDNSKIIELAKYVTDKVPDAFMDKRHNGFYKNKGFYLSSPKFNQYKWVIVKDEDDIQVLVPRSLARPQDIVS